MEITTAKTVILAADAARFGRTVVLQNTGTVSVSVGIGAANVAALTADVGLLVVAGGKLTLTGPEAAADISGITTSGTGAIRSTII